MILHTMYVRLTGRFPGSNDIYIFFYKHSVLESPYISDEKIQGGVFDVFSLYGTDKFQVCCFLVQIELNIIS